MFGFRKEKGVLATPAQIRDLYRMGRITAKCLREQGWPAVTHRLLSHDRCRIDSRTGRRMRYINRSSGVWLSEDGTLHTMSYLNGSAHFGPWFLTQAIWPSAKRVAKIKAALEQLERR